MFGYEYWYSVIDLVTTVLYFLLFYWLVFLNRITTMGVSEWAFLRFNEIVVYNLLNLSKDNDNANKIGRSAGTTNTQCKSLKSVTWGHQPWTFIIIGRSTVTANTQCKSPKSVANGHQPWSFIIFGRSAGTTNTQCKSLKSVAIVTNLGPSEFWTPVTHLQKTFQTYIF